MKEKLRLAVLFGTLAYSLTGLFWQARVFASEDDTALLLLAMAGFTLVGSILLIRRPGNRIGRLLMAPVACVATSGFLYSIALSTTIPLQIRVWAELIADQFWFLMFAALGSLVILFPTGTAKRRLDRLALLTLYSLLTGVIGASLLQPKFLHVTRRPNPIGLEATQAMGEWLISDDSFVLFLGTMLLALVGLVRRWRATEGIGRLQFRVFGAGAAVFVAGLLVSNFVADDSRVSYIGFALALVAIPLAIGAAVLRYRLFDIDRIISRTAAYSVLAALLAAIYVIGVALTQRVIPTQNQLGVVVSTLIVAALFNPLRSRVQTAVDRRFNRSRYDSRWVLEDFSARLREEVDLELLQNALLSLAQDTLQPSYLSLWLRQQEPGSP